MKIFVTGGTGFIGSHLIDSLLTQKNIQIYALVRNLQNLKWLDGLDINFLHGDLKSIPLLPSDIDYIFHIAGSSKARKSADYYTVNQEGTASLFESLQEQGLKPKRVIYLSSQAAAGPGTIEHPSRESDTPAPVSPYGVSKLRGEEEALKYKEDFPILILRVGPVFGPRDRDFVSYFKFIKKGILPAFGPAGQFMSICYVKDLIRACLLSMDAPLASGEILNIADPKPYTWDDIGRIASQSLGTKLHRIRFPLPIVYVVAVVSELIAKIRQKPSIINLQKIKEMRQEAWIVDTQNAQQKLAFKPEYSLPQAIAETIHWYQDHSWL